MFNTSKPSSVVSHQIKDKILSRTITKSCAPLEHIHPNNKRKNTTRMKPEQCVMAKGDSAASHHYWREEDKKVLDNIESYSGPSVLLPNNSTIAVTSKGQLALSSNLSARAKNAMILPGLKSASLISIGQLCDDGCNVLLNDRKLYALKNKEIVIEGDRNPSDGLWDIPIFKTSISKQNYPAPHIHPGIYPSRSPAVLNSLIAGVDKAMPKQQKSRIHKDFRNFDSLITDNMDYDAIEKQIRDDKKLYAPVTIQSPSMSVIIQKKKTRTELVQYLHGAAFSPVKSTLEKAVKLNFFKTWPGLTAEVLKHLPTSQSTVQGHQHQDRQNLQSTKYTTTQSTDMEAIRKHFVKLKAKQKPGQSIRDVLLQELDDDSFPLSPTPNNKTNDVAYMIINRHEVNTAYTDLTGRFPCRSSSGNEYVMIAYHYDGNCIVGKALKDRKKDTIRKTWQALHDTFKTAGVAPNTYVMDNEISLEFITTLEQNSVNYQLVPPHTHRRNLAERAIQTWKNHFKAGLASVDPNFPLTEWDRLIEQANITLNLLRSARSNPLLSAYTYIFGEFNFAATPLAPPGTKIVAHIKPSVRRT